MVQLHDEAGEITGTLHPSAAARHHETIPAINQEKLNREAVKRAARLTG